MVQDLQGQWAETQVRQLSMLNLEDEIKFRIPAVFTLVITADILGK